MPADTCWPPFQELDRPSVGAADLLRLKDGAPAFGIEAEGVPQDVNDICLEVGRQQIGVVANVFGPLWREGSFRRDTGACHLAARHKIPSPTSDEVRFLRFLLGKATCGGSVKRRVPRSCDMTSTNPEPE